MNGNNLNFVRVNDTELIEETASLAYAIWREHYIPIIGSAQVEYMLERFQSVPAIDRQIKDGYVYYLVSNRENRYIGYFCVIIQEDRMFLSKIYLKSDARGKGLGRQMLGFIEKLALEKGCLQIWLTVNKNNVKSLEFYKKCGFNVTGPVVQDIGQGFVMDDFRLEKPV